MERSWGKSSGFAAVLLQYSGGFTPKVISKTKPTPITFNVAAKIAWLDPVEKHPPALTPS